jgi:uncharacterized protein HemX
MMDSRKAAIAGAALVAALGIGLTVPAFAQDATETPSDETTREERHAAHEAAFAEALAEELGLDADRVAEAIDTVRTAMMAERRAERLAALQERLDAAVEAGTLTREQADALLEAHESGVLGGFGRRGGRGHGPGRFGPFSQDAGPEATPSAPTTSV